MAESLKLMIDHEFCVINNFINFYNYHCIQSKIQFISKFHKIPHFLSKAVNMNALQKVLPYMKNKLVKALNANYFVTNGKKLN